MRKTSFHKPYKKRKGKVFNTFLHSYFKGKSGCYIIKKGRMYAYVGQSGSDVYKTMYRHFQSWNDKTQRRVVYPKFSNDITVQIILCTPSQALRLETILIKRYKPTDNAMKLELINNAENRRVEDSLAKSKQIKENYIFESRGEAPF